MLALDLDLDIVILAAGKGTRMSSDLPKVLHPLVGRPLLQRVLDTASLLKPKNVFVIVGHQADKVQQSCSDYTCQWVLQTEQLGTGHAVQQALPYLSTPGRTLILYGDVPLVTQSTLQRFIDNTPSSAVGLLTAIVNEPFGLGRVMRNASHHITHIVEEKDASFAQKLQREINTGIYLLPTEKLKEWLPTLENNNAQKEFYLTDIVKLAVAQSVPICDLQVADEKEILGINDRKQLITAQREFLKRRALDLVEEGVEILDPARLDIRGEATIGTGTKIDINVVMEGKVIIGKNCHIAQNCYLRDCEIGDNVEILANSVIEESILRASSHVGPFARVRPGTEIAEEARVGNFVELKKTYLGKHSKANHLSYVGDSIIGEYVNIGAGTITCNYDGIKKSKTEIEDGAFIGSNSSLVAPVKIEKNAIIGAGSVITRNAPAGKLTLSRVKQTTIEKGFSRTPKSQEKSED